MPTEPCHKRFELRTVEIVQMGINPSKKYAVCMDDRRPNKGLGVVCPCNGCGRKCSGYSVEPSYSEPRSSDITDMEDHES